MVKRASQPVVLTVGHSTRPLAALIALLAVHSVSRLIGVRTVPRSRLRIAFIRPGFMGWALRRRAVQSAIYTRDRVDKAPTIVKRRRDRRDKRTRSERVR